MKHNMNRNLVNYEFSTRFACKLSEDAVKEFFEMAYSVRVSLVETLDATNEYMKYRVVGRYVHSGFNNVSFEGIFYAYDLGYIFQTIVERLSTNNLELWRMFMTQKFGEEYAIFKLTYIK